MLKRGWRETEGDEWDIHWAERDWINEYFDTMHLNAWQKVNHFRNSRELCRKDLLVKKLSKVKSIGTFLQTNDGLKTTAPEGFVAVDRVKGNAVKLVNRLEFSRANFTATKNWVNG